jgi:hypothetical protein
MAMQRFRFGNLPIPPTEYSPEHLRQAFRILELYFNQLDSLTPNQAESYRADNFYGGDFIGYGQNLVFPHIAASDSTDQIATGNNTATQVKFNTLDSSFGWTLNPSGSATATYDGVYKITFSLQFINSANAIHYATVWLKINNINADNSSTVFTIPARKSASPGEEGYICGYSEATFTVIAGDEVELYWATDLAGNPTSPTNGVYIYHDGPQVSPFVRPAIPSVIGSITFVSSLLYKTVVRLSSVSASGSLGTVSVTIVP